MDYETGTQDYGMRIYNTNLGRFLSLDPLTKSYPYYTPYLFAGNLPTKFVDIDGMETGELVINDPNARIATLTWKKTYYVVVEGAGKVHKTNLLNETDVNKQFNSGANTIYTNVLPTSKNSAGEFDKVKSKPKDAWENGKKTWKVNVVFDISIVTVDLEGKPITIEIAKIKVQENPQLNGLIKDQNNIQNTAPAKFGSKTALAAGTVGNDSWDTDLIHTNDTYYGENSQKIPASLSPTAIITHEISHNFGLHHEVGDYTQPGLMNNKTEEVKPTQDNNIEMINDNINSIKLIEDK